MPFTSYDDLISEITIGKRLHLPFVKTATSVPVALNWYHLWTVSGYPTGALNYPGVALAFQRTNELTQGALHHGGNRAPETKHLIYKMIMSNATEPRIVMLADMVGYYPCVQAAASQTFDNTTGPDRYVAAGQEGLQCILVNGGTVAMGATASNLTVLTYVNQDGVAGRLMPTSPTVTMTISTAAPTTALGSRVITTVAGAFLPLQQGDSGIRSLTNFSCSAANTGSMAFLLVRPLIVMPFPGSNIPAERDLVMQVANLERVFDGACLTWFTYTSAAMGHTISGNLDIAWG